MSVENSESLPGSQSLQTTNPDQRPNRQGALQEQIIQLNPGDEIATIRDKIQWAGAPRVVLYVPRRNRALRDKMNLKLVQRTAVDNAMQIALVARHPETVRLAQEIGLPVFWTTRSLLPWRNWNGPAPLFVPDEDGDVLTVVTPSESRMHRDYRLASAIAAGAFILLIGTMVMLLLPTARITIAPVTDDVSVEHIEVSANANVKSVNTTIGQIPAKIDEVTLDGSEQLVPNAKKDVPDAKAAGSVLLTNRTNQAIHVAKGTVVATSAGVPVRFQTTGDVDVAPAARVDTPVVALEGGPSGNVGRFTINSIEGPLAVSLIALNQNPTSGGTVKRANVVSEDDKTRLEQILMSRFRQEAITKLQGKVQENEFLATETISITLDSKTFDKFVDEPADLLTLTAHATAQGLIVNGANANIVALKRLESKLRTGFELLPDTIQFVPGGILAADPTSIRFEMNAKGKSAEAIDRDAIGNSVRGLTTKEATAWLQQHLTLQRDPAFVIQPDWLGTNRLPYFNFRISVDVTQ